MKTIIYVTFLAFVSCTYSNKKNDTGDEKFNLNDSIYENNELKESKIGDIVQEDSCKEKEVWVGKLQYSKIDDLMILGTCYTDNNYYDYAFVYDEKILDPSKLLNIYKKSKLDNQIIKFRGYLFSVKMKLNPNPENEFDKYEYDFPFSCNSYKFYDNNWIFLEQTYINSYNDLIKFKENLIKSNK